MIEIVAIDNRKAEAELLRMAADFAQSRLFAPKQAKRIAVVVEVSGDEPARPTTREQLAQKAGLFRSAKYHYVFCVSVAHGFEAAVLQMMHELVHIAQITTMRYQLKSSVKKIDGTKQTIWHARWCGKKAGIIDDIAWHERAWEQEAVAIGEQLSSEFLSFIYGTQGTFEAQGGKKDLRLHPVSIALPDMPAPDQMPVDEALVGEALADEGLPDITTPFDVAPDVSSAEMPIADSEIPAAPSFDAPSFDAPAFDAPQMARDESAPQADFAQVDDDALIADIDALLSQDETPPSQALVPEELPEEISEDVPEEATQETYVAGFAAPRMLKLSVLEAKQKELAERGLLEK